MSKITLHPGIRFGKPCIDGTRIAVSDILNLLAKGYSTAEILTQYPAITKKDVVRAIKFASQLVDQPTKIMTV